ncbi:putative transcriptional regulator, TrmB family [Aeropyrum pernix K1]|uniref:Transcriptional regulator, TrmB family n=1 Tax=Aeropyrum pernix (strain ATCC 700893 / DSM 11879 / JCM 9820 / NBRC 100138 / K1) TaxID=272557 RepID=Q9YG76_AERPE|nr:helix-turn-helix domain-containing protein [Aeropyrum pernix]BAA78934.2 putative transcriptional regulator, TrmB family [Aeropyrum pernix K1]
MISREIVGKLTSLGFKEYEARVYAALVLYGPSKAGEISLRSGVPRPRVYDVLRDLIAKGFVERTQGSPTYYRAVDPEHVIGEMRDRYVRSAEEAIIELKLPKGGMRRSSCPYSIWRVSGVLGIVSNFLLKERSLT